jgi:hypothetical protein
VIEPDRGVVPADEHCGPRQLSPRLESGSSRRCAPRAHSDSQLLAAYSLSSNRSTAHPCARSSSNSIRRGLNSVLTAVEADEFSVPGAESQRAQDVPADGFPAAASWGATVVFCADGKRPRRRPRAGYRSPARDRRSPHVIFVGESLAGRGGQFSADGRVAFATAHYDQPAFAVAGDWVIT